MILGKQRGCEWQEKWCLEAGKIEICVIYTVAKSLIKLPLDKTQKTGSRGKGWKTEC